MATAGIYIPLASYLPGFYAQSLGMGLSTVGAIFTASRLWSAFTDPLVGYLSDRTHTRYGRRKPWIAGGCLLFVAGIGAIFHPPAAPGALYLAAMLLTLCLGWSMTTTPLYAWGAELSRRYHERSRVQTYLQTSACVGIFLVAAAPAAMDRMGGYSMPQKLFAMALLLVGPIAVGLPILLARFREPAIRAHGGAPAPSAPWRTLLRERLLWSVVASDFSVSLGQGFRNSVLLFFTAAVMHDARIGSLVLFLQFAVGLLASPLWLQVSYRLGKHRTLVVAECCQVIINLLLLALAPGQLGALMALTVAQGLTQGSGNLMLKAIVSDVADAHRLKSGRRVTGLFFSIFNVTANAGLALAVGIAFFALDRFGFVPGQQNSVEAVRALHVFFAVAPATGHAVSALIMWRFPLDESRHAAVLRELTLRGGAD
jgi:glycoside/pentoside/hexuronide:cation symporter, GPH family